ncbi:MAG: hypothetical protein H6745_09315 [Deltaproteobacteria bacterium]|nr:hypothetical protein [Deltaproteobacteria bacterium]
MDSGQEWIVNPGAHVARLTGGDVAVDALTVRAPARGRGVQTLVVDPEDPLHDALVRILLLREPLASVPLEPKVRDRLVQAGVLVRAGHTPSSGPLRCEGDPAANEGYAAVAPPELLTPELFADGTTWYRDALTGIRTPWVGGEPVAVDVEAVRAALETAVRGLDARHMAEVPGIVPAAQVEATARFFAGRASDGALAVDPSRGRSESRDDRLAAFWARELGGACERLTGEPLAPVLATYVSFRAGARVDGSVPDDALLAGMWCLTYDGVEVGLLPLATPSSGGAVPTAPGTLALWRPSEVQLEVFRVPPGRTLAVLLMAWGAPADDA